MLRPTMSVSSISKVTLRQAKFPSSPRGRARTGPPTRLDPALKSTGAAQPFGKSATTPLRTDLTGTRTGLSPGRKLGACSRRKPWRGEHEGVIRMLRSEQALPAASAPSAAQAESQQPNPGCKMSGLGRSARGEATTQVNRFEPNEGRREACQKGGAAEHLHSAAVWPLLLHSR
jgi:hypothetical protein